MAEAILAQLSIKELPKLQQPINIGIKKSGTQQPVKIATKIVDKRIESDMDRAKLLAKIGLTVESKISPSKIKEEEEEFDLFGPKPAAQRTGVPGSIKSIALADISAPTKDVVAGPIIDKPKKKLVLKPATEHVSTQPLKPVYTIGEAVVLPEQLQKQLPIKKEDIMIRAPAYYMNNREIFINFITSLFYPYKKEIEENKENYSCEKKKSTEFSALTHQKIISNYINLYTPYRGLLVYHGLGSGKTCTSIGVAEGLKSDKQIIIMTPASLRVNYIEELKKCGDNLYKKNQYWEFINIQANPDLLEPLSYALSLPIEIIKKNTGVWFVNVNKPSNYSTLSSEQQLSLDIQLNEMIKHKYYFINYNGIRQNRLDMLTKQNTINPFSDKVIIIDEVHNFVSRISNKLDKPDTLSMQLYHLLMSAENAKIILLTGTPIINHPNEIAIAMNILRGYIKTWSFKLSINKQRKVTQDYLIKLFKSRSLSNNIFDYLQYKPTSNTLVITRNPYGFYTIDKSKEYKGVKLGEDGNVDDATFIKIITEILAEKEITIIPESIQVENYKCLPDTKSDFSDEFIEKNTVKNMNLFKKRILGLISYFPDINALLPQYDRKTDFYIINIPMSPFQFQVYEKARVEERKIELRNAQKRAKGIKKGVAQEEDSSSTYRIFSRAFCNFVFPHPDIVRPLPRGGDELSSTIIETANEDLLDAISIDDDIQAAEAKYDEEDIKEIRANFDEELNKSYESRIKRSLKLLEQHKETYLTPEALETYSPKFLNILSNIIEEQYIGLHLIYSQFRTLEGIGILALVLKTNGFTEFKIIKEGNTWKINIPIEERGKPTYVLYTGTESAEEKEIIRNIFNSNWDLIPESLRLELQGDEEHGSIASNNYYGEIIKVIMITASGAEGISLNNVRYVHITEPYWHPVRIEQIIGRARRICSHKNLPKELQTVEVFLYLMIFTEKQLKSDDAIELIANDKSKLNPTKIYTSDQALYEIAIIKENINKEILHNIKEASIDCNIHLKLGGKEQLKCFTFGKVNSDKFAYTTSLSNEDTDQIAHSNKEIEKLKLKNVKIPGKGEMIVNMNNVGIGKGIVKAEVYTLESVENDNPIHVGYLEFNENKPITFIDL
jgi:hypothetical protein